MATEPDRYNVWYGRVRDALFFGIGVGVLATESYIRLTGGSSDATFVAAGVTLLLAAFTGVSGRWVVKKIENGQ